MEANRRLREQLKRIFDMVVASATAFALVPIAGLIAVFIKLEDRGPVLFRQERLGRNRKPFQIFKFRTMVVDAERGTGPVWAVDRDPRATRVGRLLRASHLDELPQLWNVVRGEMSLVGPRPERSHFVAQLEPLVPNYGERFAARPGITGLSQLRSGYDLSIRTVRRKIRYDRFYLRRACFLLDLRLLMGTVGHLCARTRRLAAVVAAGVLVVGSAPRLQASPGSPSPDGSGRANPPETPPAAARTAFPRPGGAALLGSVGLDSELVLSADYQPAGKESQASGSNGSWDPDSFTATGSKKGKPPDGEPLPVSEPGSIPLVIAGLAWLARRERPGPT